MPPLDVNALHALELRALELHELAGALLGLVIPLGLIDFERRGIPILVPAGVETTHDVGRDRLCRPLKPLGGPPPPFHPREVRSQVVRHAAARAQVRPEARQLDRYLLGGPGESPELLLPRPPRGNAAAVDALEPDGRGDTAAVVAPGGLPLAQAQLIDHAEGVRPYGGIVLPRDQSPPSSARAAANDGGTAPALAAIRPGGADAIVDARPGRSIVALLDSTTRQMDLRYRRGMWEERRCAAFVLPRRRAYSLSRLPSHERIQVHYEIAPNARHRSPMPFPATIGGLP